MAHMWMPEPVTMLGPERIPDYIVKEIFNQVAISRVARHGWLNDCDSILLPLPYFSGQFLANIIEYLSENCK